MPQNCTQLRPFFELIKLFWAICSSLNDTNLYNHVHYSIEVVHIEDFLYQVDEITDIGSRMRERYHERAATPARCLKLSITDGVQRVFGIEYRPIHALHCLSPSGLKVLRTLWRTDSLIFKFWQVNLFCSSLIVYQRLYRL